MTTGFETLKRSLGFGCLLALALGGVGPAFAAVGTWTVTGSMTAPRDHHTATLLTSGLVLVSGGDSPAYPGPSVPAYASAELYDLAAGTWSPTSSMATGRTLHRATLLIDGRVLVSGGLDQADNVLASLELYDPATTTWAPAGSMTTARVSHSATLLPDGRVLIVGGQDALRRPTSSAELYDPATGTSTLTGNMARPRSGHTESLLLDGTVLVTGSQVGAEVYDPSTGTWSSTQPMKFDRVAATATGLNDGRVLVAGGDYPTSAVADTAELYEPATRTWTSTTSMNFARDGHRAVLLNDGTVLVVGSDYDGGFINGEVYEPASARWTLTPNLNAGRSRGPTATLLTTGQVLVAGGSFDATSAELYTSPSPGVPVRSTRSLGASAANALRPATAHYDRSTKLLHVRVTDTRQSGSFTVTVEPSGKVVGTLTHANGSAYTGTFSWPVDPETITIRDGRGRSISIRLAVE